MKKVRLITDPKTGQVTSVRIITTNIYYFVSPAFVEEHKDRSDDFKRAYKIIKDMK